MFRWKRIATAIVAATLFTMMPQGALAAENAGAGPGETLAAAEVSPESGDELNDDAAPAQEEDGTGTADEQDAEEGSYGKEADEADTGTEAAEGRTDSDPEDIEDGTGADPDTVNGGETNGEAVPAADPANGADNGSTAAAGEAEDADTGVTEAAAAASDDAEATLISIHGIVEREFVQYGEIDSEALAGQYFERARSEAGAASERGTAAGQAETADRIAGTGSAPEEASDPGKGAGLKGIDKVIYDSLREAVSEIAAGERATGVVRIPIPLSSFGLGGGFTAADLGLDYVYDGTLNPELADAVEKIAPVRFDEIMDCLIADSACEMYPLTGGAEKPAGNALPFYISGNGNDWDVHLDGYLEISLKPAECFADPDSGRYAIDTAKIQSMLGVSAAASKAAENDARTGSRGTNRAGTCPSETK